MAQPKRILFYLSAGAGDLINFTGTLKRIRETHEPYTLDFLIKKKHKYILDNHIGIDNLLFFEDYPKLPGHCTIKGHDVAVHLMFDRKYDHVLNCWGCKGKYNNGDFIAMMADLMRDYGFIIPFSRYDLNAYMYYSQEDHDIVDRLRATIPNGRIVLIEDECFSWQTPQIALLPGISTALQSNGYIVAANHVHSDVSVRSLNLKQIKLFFDKYCYAFLGLSSGMTCTVYALPNDFSNKKVLVSGFYDNWNMDVNLASYGTGRYTFMHGVYTVEDALRILG